MFSQWFYPRTTSGLDAHTYYLSKYLARDGVDVHVYASICNGDVDGINVHRVGVIHKPLGLGFPEALIYSLNACSRKFDVDLYHSQGSFGFGCALFGKKPLVSTLHSNAKAFMSTSKKILGKLSMLAFYYSDSFTFNKSDALISVSKSLADSVPKDLNITSPISVIPNGVELNRFLLSKDKDHLRDELKLPKEIPIVLFVGSLIHRKGPKLLIRAMARIKQNALCVFIGTGAEMVSSKELASQLKVNANFRGFVSSEDLPKYYCASDIFVLPSFSEGMPIACLEAMASSLPVIASNIDGIRETVDDKKSGLLFQPGNVPELSDYLSELLADELLRVKLGKCGLDIIKSKFLWEKIAKQTIQIYDKVI